MATHGHAVVLATQENPLPFKKGPTNRLRPANSSSANHLLIIEVVIISVVVPHSDDPGGQKCRRIMVNYIVSLGKCRTLGFKTVQSTPYVTYTPFD